MAYGSERRGGGFRERSSGRSGGFGGSRGGFGDRRSSGGFGNRRPEMHDVICDKCKAECQVPFRPTGDKPVLCSDCFRKDGGASTREMRSSSGSSSSGMSQDQFKQINAKLDKIIAFLDQIEFEDEGEEGDEDEEALGEEDSEEATEEKVEESA
ncbi:MAG: CxxC-x17-CxxC domain-containing protein [Nanoarchaeota archaeon]|mgnify:CR=1 FL=1